MNYYDPYKGESDIIVIVKIVFECIFLEIYLRLTRTAHTHKILQISLEKLLIIRRS